MGGLLSSLNTSYTGLQAHQGMVDVTGGNISNASDEFYSRQKVITNPQNPITKGSYNIGNGVNIDTVMRVHDEFVFQRYQKAATDKSFYEAQFQKLREASTFFPDVQEVGIYNDLEKYFNAWKDLSKNAKDPAQKQVVAQSAKNLINTIKSTRNNLKNLQHKASEELAVNVESINRLGSQIAELNARLNEKESHKNLKYANELRDRRDKLEFQLKEIVGGNITKSNLKANQGVDHRSVDYGENYVLNIGNGVNIIDGAFFHPLVVENSSDKSGLNKVYFQNDDFKKLDITNKLIEGKVGGLLELYSNGSGESKTGKLQEYIDKLDTFTNGFIEATNNIYAQSATNSILSENLSISPIESLSDSMQNVKNGSFDIVVYNSDGEAIATKTINIDSHTSMNDVVKSINSNTDDNGDKNSLNDVDDYFVASFDSNKFQINAKNPSQGLYIGVKDNGSNFAGAIGINRLFDGYNASNIALNVEYDKDPTLIRPWLSPSIGNFDVANMMQQLQYDAIGFNMAKGQAQNMTISEYYQTLAGKVASQTQAIKNTLDTKQSVFEAVKKEHLAISQVSVDEEMVNLIKFQSGYAANAKVVSTIDKMIDTLLGIKQ